MTFPDCLPPFRFFLAANLLWNNMMQRVGHKSESSMDFIMKDFVCPTIKNPYIFTANNSVLLNHRNNKKNTDKSRYVGSWYIMYA